MTKRLAHLASRSLSRDQTHSDSVLADSDVDKWKNKSREEEECQQSTGITSLKANQYAQEFYRPGEIRRKVPGSKHRRCGARKTPNASTKVDSNGNKEGSYRCTSSTGLGMMSTETRQ